MVAQQISNTMELYKRVLLIVVGVGGSACATPPAIVPATPEPVPEPVSQPVTPSVSPAPVRSGPWAFTYRQGTYTYDIVTQATIAQWPDTSIVQTVPAVTQRVTIALGDSGASVLSPQVPAADGCTESAALASRAEELIPRIPLQLEVGAHWTDSLTTDGCRGAIPATATLVRSYIVRGDTTYNGTPALHIVRTAVINAKGIGHDGQHRILMSASGDESADLYFDVSAGRFLGLEGRQTTDVAITTSGRTNQFLQRVTERVTLDASISP
jgi:hypothetical protein